MSTEDIRMRVRELSPINRREIIRGLEQRQPREREIDLNPQNQLNSLRVKTHSGLGRPTEVTIQFETQENEVGEIRSRGSARELYSEVRFEDQLLADFLIDEAGQVHVSTLSESEISDEKPPLWQLASSITTMNAFLTALDEDPELPDRSEFQEFGMGQSGTGPVALDVCETACAGGVALGAKEGAAAVAGACATVVGCVAGGIGVGIAVFAAYTACDKLCP
ncbi:hypothetical protein [Halalkalicoccus sp. NIPERK01]|uniref:hypothetical protein n=1 Tax=Halalkalicoccus sp. NIPERK01 TaxID=3053469 RepID=UPI00256F0381|nr:hypothetical protein [Halalkalicoccus sp. NIPERK01]MDL5363822.1 hypothetical protein [Halalkalicoccus sp. NIPERK01]